MRLLVADAVVYYGNDTARGRAREEKDSWIVGCRGARIFINLNALVSSLASLAMTKS